MKEEIEKLIKSYQDRMEKCLMHIKEFEELPPNLSNAYEKKRYESIALLWKVVINDLKKLNR